MAYCAYCGTEISELAENCPNCGHPNEARATPSALAPEGMPAAALRYAGFWRRFAALFIDALLVGIVAYMAFGQRVIVQTELGPVSVRQVPPAVSTLMNFLYHWLMLSFVRGQTLGKMALGIRIMTPDGRVVDPGRAAAREGMAIVSGIVLGLGFLWAAWDPEKRTWHDIVANTRAFRTR